MADNLDSACVALLVLSTSLGLWNHGTFILLPVPFAFM
jgi:hypothetical protein